MVKRRKEAVTWFPTLGTHPSEADAVNGVAFALDVTDGTVNLTGVLPLTFDYPQESNAVDPEFDGISDIIGNEYICKRIVGKMFAGLKATADNGTPAVLFGAGIFVARADPDTGPNGADSPIGRVNEVDDNYGTLNSDTTREPWMWRRTWVLGNLAYDPVNFPQSAHLYPPTTAGYGSMADGPHIDVRVKRRVGQDDRLWLSVTARPYPLSNVAIGGTFSLQGYFDYRILGSLRKARNRSAF